MNNYNDTILYETRQHRIVLVFRFLRNFAIVGIPLFLVAYFVFFPGVLAASVTAVTIGVLSFLWTYFFWSKSYFIITNKKISIKVRNGIFSKFHVSLYYKNIKDIAYSKNNALHYLLDCGTFFARSSAGSIGDFEGPWLPEIEKIYKYVNNIYLLSDIERDNLKGLEGMGIEKHEVSLHRDEGSDLVSENRNKTASGTRSDGDIGRQAAVMEITETLEEIIQKEKTILLSIQGIKEVILLDNADRSFIFDHEEDRNHGVYESLKKKVLFAVTHDSTFRSPDEAIVFQKGEKVIFPTVGFHEIKRAGVLSASPGVTVHEYLVPKFQSIDSQDATILVGFDE